jgi:hypothetical protein
MTAQPQSKLNDTEMDLTRTQARLDRLERHEWWRWTLAFVVMLTLTVGMFALSLPAVGGRTPEEQAQLNVILRALLGLVLLFDVFVIHQQVLIKRLRRDLATQLGVITTLEMLKKDDDANCRQKERRRIPRSGLDRRLRVTKAQQGKQACFHGWIRDITEEGMGAVVPCSLNIGEQVTLEFSAGDGLEGTVSAIVRHRQGFHYGFDFDSIEPSLSEAIARLRETAAMPVA